MLFVVHFLWGVIFLGPALCLSLRTSTNILLRALWLNVTYHIPQKLIWNKSNLAVFCCLAKTAGMLLQLLSDTMLRVHHNHPIKIGGPASAPPCSPRQMRLTIMKQASEGGVTAITFPHDRRWLAHFCRFEANHLTSAQASHHTTAAQQ